MKLRMENLKQFANTKKKAQEIKGGDPLDQYACSHSSSSEVSFHNGYEAAQLMNLGVSCINLTVLSKLRIY